MGPSLSPHDEFQYRPSFGHSLTTISAGWAGELYYLVTALVSSQLKTDIVIFIIVLNSGYILKVVPYCYVVHHYYCIYLVS